MFDDGIRDPLVEVSKNLDERTSDAGGGHVQWDHVVGIRHPLLSIAAAAFAAVQGIHTYPTSDAETMNRSSHSNTQLIPEGG